MRLLIPFILIILFVFYIAYLLFVKRELGKHLHSVVYPGLFFILVWGLIYYFLFS